MSKYVELKITNANINIKTSYFTINSQCSQKFYTTIKFNRNKLLERKVCLIKT